MERRGNRVVAVASLLACVAGGVLACAGPAAVRTALPTLEAGDTDGAKGFEEPPVVSAREVLPPELLSGPHHHVHDEVKTDGFLRIYSISSDFGDFEAHGDDMLRIRVDEIEALAKLDEGSRTEDFARALGETLKSPFVATWNLVTKPVDSLTGLPTGAWKQIKRTARMTRGERGEHEDSALREFIGFEARKREIAHEIGVDPYSSNKVLQKQLNRVAWVAYVGGLPSMFVPFTDPQRQATESEARDEADRLGELLLDYSPEDLRRLNRIELAVMGIPEASRDAFVSHPWYSPRHQTVLVAALAELDLTRDRALFIDAAITADSEDDAHYYQRTAELLRAYQQEVEPIERIVLVSRSVTGYTASGRLLAPLPVDYAVWTRPTAAFAERLARAQPEGTDVREREMLLSGTLSKRARSRIQGLGITVTERAFERLQPPAPEPTASVVAPERTPSGVAPEATR